MFIQFSLSVLTEEEQAILFYILNEKEKTQHTEGDYVFDRTSVFWLKPGAILFKVEKAKQYCRPEHVNELDTIFNKLKSHFIELVNPIDAEIVTEPNYPKINLTPKKSKTKQLKK
jgi:hypothetical protein